VITAAGEGFVLRRSSGSCKPRVAGGRAHSLALAFEALPAIDGAARFSV
jgi:hypothetical protein